MNTNKTGSVGVGLLALSLAFAAPATGQQAVSTGVNGADATALAEANELRAEAVELYGTRESNWAKVVKLHLLAAKVAPRDDPGRVQDLWMAGSVSAALGNLRDGQRYLERAAGLALELKNNFRASEIYLAAAITAARQGEYGDANRLLDRADEAANPDLIDPKLFDGLKTRIAMLRGGGY